MATDTRRTRSERIEVRASPEERDLIDRAVAATGTDLTSFVVDNLTLAARRVLADRSGFTLDAPSRTAWDAMNALPSRDLAGLRSLMRRPSPFAE